MLALNGNLLPTSGELKPDSDIANSEDPDNEDVRDDSVDFEKEVIIGSLESLLLLYLLKSYLYLITNFRLKRLF